MLSGDPFSPVSAVKYSDKQGNHFGDQDETGSSRRRVQIPGTTASGIRLQKTWTTLKGQLPKGRMPCGHFPGTVPPFSVMAWTSSCGFRRLPAASDGFLRLRTASNGLGRVRHLIWRPDRCSLADIMSSPTSSMFAANY